MGQSPSCPTLVSDGVVQACGIVDGEEIESRGRPGRVKVVFLRMDEQAILNVTDLPLRGTCLLLNFYPHTEICLTQS